MKQTHSLDLNGLNPALRNFMPYCPTPSLTYSKQSSEPSDPSVLLGKFAYQKPITQNLSKLIPQIAEIPVV